MLPPGVASESQARLNDERVLQDIPKRRDRSNWVMISHDLDIPDVVLEPAVMGEFFVMHPSGGISMPSSRSG